MIDDNPAYVESLLENDITTDIFSAPWNKTATFKQPSVFKLNSWQDLIDNF